MEYHKQIMEMAQNMKRMCEEIEELCRENMGEYEMHRMRELAGMGEAAKPSAGLSAKQKTAVVKKAKAGGDIGKPGKGFEKVEKQAAKYGAKNPKAVAAAAMWKSAAKKAK